MGSTSTHSPECWTSWRRRRLPRDRYHICPGPRDPAAGGGDDVRVEVAGGFSQAGTRPDDGGASAEYGGGAGVFREAAAPVVGGYGATDRGKAHQGDSYGVREIGRGGDGGGGSGVPGDAAGIAGLLPACGAESGVRRRALRRDGDRESLRSGADAQGPRERRRMDRGTRVHARDVSVGAK